MPSGIGEKKKKEKRRLKYSNLTKDGDQSPAAGSESYLHGSGTHVREDFFSGAGILVITNSGMNAPLQVQNIEHT